MIRTVVVGAGAAGAPLSARLSEDSDRQVTLLEAGSVSATPLELLDGTQLPAAMPGHWANWSYPAELMPGRAYTVARGKVLGGSSATNGGYFVRARPSDFDRWAVAGGAEWSYANVAPILAAIENDLDHQPVDSVSGPVPIQRPPMTSEITLAFQRAALSIGFALEPDKNAAGRPGIGPVPSNIVGGERRNMGVLYLEPVRDRHNLTVTGDSEVSRVIIEQERVLGVETASGFIEADEVVLCAGAIGTSKILLQSGIGPRGQLEGLGVPVNADLPVGEAFSDHPNIAVGWHARAPLCSSGALVPFPAALNFDSSGQAQRFPDGDLEVLLSAYSLARLLADSSGALPGAAAYQLIVALQAPVGRGRLSLRSANPLDPLRIEYRYIENESDRCRLRLGVRTAVELLRSGPLSQYFGGLTELEDSVLDDNERLDEWMQAYLGTANHMCGTAPMGQVVDGSGRVRGIEGLRLADTSILPSVPSRGPFATAVFLGEFIARKMREDRADRPISIAPGADPVCTPSDHP